MGERGYSKAPPRYAYENYGFRFSKTRIGLNCWNFWKQSRNQNFIDWFELEVFGGKTDDDNYDVNITNVFR